ncbi:MAG: rRNA adenine dimethyltransferase family protein [bacterium]|nr:rRNA adenine dimethyltransferase family protein [bacterium]
MLTSTLLHVPTLKALCERAGMRPSRASGQNFLINEHTLAQVVAAVDPQCGETILEVGAGFGVLTLALASSLSLRGSPRPKQSRPMAACGRTPDNARDCFAPLRSARNDTQQGRIIAIERDPRIVPILREHAAVSPQITVIEANVLEVLDRGPQELLSPGAHASPYKMVANLPYSITSDFLRALFDAAADGTLPPPERVVLLLQYEVVERLIGRTQQDRSLLTMLAHLHCGSVHRVARVPATHFWPAPKVQSAVIALSEWRTPDQIAALVGGVGRAKLISIMQQGYASKRKQLQNTIAVPHDDAWHRAGIAPTARPAELTLQQWIALAYAIVNE